jgi:hypothetical protein
VDVHRSWRPVFQIHISNDLNKAKADPVPQAEELYAHLDIYIHV